MPQNITDVDEFTDPCTAPADGDTRNAASVLTPFQKLANRTRYLYNVLTSTGVRKIRTVASSGALKALTGMVPGDVAILLSGVPQLYVYRSIALAGSDLAGMRYDSTTAIGQWVSAWFYLASLSSGSPRLDVQTLPPPNRIVDVVEDYQVSPSATNATLGGGIFGPTLSIPVEENDIVLIDGHCTFSAQSADGDGYVAIAVEGTPTLPSKRRWTALGSPYAFLGPLCPSLRYVVGTTGTITVRLYQIASNLVSGTPQFIGPQHLHATVIRPLIQS